MIPVGPLRVRWIMTHLVKIEDRHGIDRRQAAAGVPGLGLIEHFKNIDPQFPGRLFQFRYGRFIEHLLPLPAARSKIPGSYE